MRPRKVWWVFSGSQHFLNVLFRLCHGQGPSFDSATVSLWNSSSHTSFRLGRSLCGKVFSAPLQYLSASFLTMSSRCDPNSQRNLLRTESSIDKAERTKPLRIEGGSCKFNSRDPHEAFIHSRTALLQLENLANRICKLKALRSAICDLEN